jgi:hypothetical protein
LLGSGPIIIKSINGEQSSCRGKRRSASNSVRGSARKAQGDFCLAAKDARDQFKGLDHFEEMLEPISQELPEDISACLASISGLEIHYVPIRQALRKVSSRQAIEKKRASAEQAVKGAQS